MEMITKGLLAVLWLVVLPLFCGIPFLNKKVKITWTESYITGFVFSLAVLEILVLPMIWLRLSLTTLCLSWGLIVAVTAMLGVLLLLRGKRRTAKKKKRKEKGGGWFVLAFVLIVLQLAVCLVLTHFDADDALFVGTATTAVETNTIFSINPYTGAAYEILPSRYVLSPFPVFLAVISRLSGGMHPALIAHVIFDVLFMGMAYLVQHLLSKKWFPENKEARGIYLFSAAILNWFSAYSIYNAGNFQMIRIWQGKAFLAAVLLPFLLYLSISMFVQKEQDCSWTTVFMTMIACALVSSMGIMLAPLLLGTFAVVGLFFRKKIADVIRAGICCIPSVILGIAYIILK